MCYYDLPIATLALVLAGLDNDTRSTVSHIGGITSKTGQAGHDYYGSFGAMPSPFVGRALTT